MRKYFMFFFTVTIGFCLILGGFPKVYAQETQSDEFTLEEIIVTAQKRGEQNLQKVPLAMDVISDKDLAAEGKANVDDILSGLASVAINTSTDGMRITIRGIADTDPVYGGRKSSSPTVAMNVDGAYNSQSNTGQNLFDVERIEVLMGPQSTLYAANSPGGIVNIITAAPKTDKYSVNASGEYGSYKHSNLQAALNAPLLKDKIAMRLSAYRTRENSFVDPGAAGTKTDAARLKTLWNATDDLSITLIGNWSKNMNAGEMGGQVKQFIKSSDSAWTKAPAGGGPGGGTNTLDQITKSGSANIDWNTAVGNLSIVPNYSQSSSVGNQTGNLTFNRGTPGEYSVSATAYSVRRNTQKGADVRMASSADFTLLKYVLGLYYYSQQFTTSSTYATYPTQDSYNISKQKQKAIYTNITYPLWFYDKFALTAGYRKSWDHSDQHGYEPGRGYDATNMDYSKPNYKFGFEYNMSDNLMLYGSWEGSYRTDSMAMKNNIGTRPPEKLTAYTIGEKTRLFDNTLQLNGSVYYYDYQDKFVQENGKGRGNYTEEQLRADGYWDLVDQGRGQVSATDGLTYYSVEDPGFHGWGDAHTIGLDASASWVASAKDMVEFSVSYLDMKWTRLRFIYLFKKYFPDTNYDGQTGPNAPKLSMTASYEHNFDIGSYGTLTPHIDVQHKSKFDLTFDTSDSPYYGHQEAYFLWNASAAFNHSSGKWSLNAIVKNITNYAVKRSYDKDNSSLMIGDPRTYNVTLSVKF